MGPPRRRARDPLPRLRAGRARGPNGPFGLRAAGDVATLRRAADRCGWRPRGMALASGGAQPGGGALRGRVSRARGELARVCAPARARGDAS